MNERLCNLYKWRTGFSLTHNSLLIQPPTCPQSSSPICVWVLVGVVGVVGTVEKVFFVCWLLLLVFVHDIFDRGFVHEFVTVLTIIETMSVRESGSRLTSESCPTREKTWFTLVSTVRWHVVSFKTTKCKGNRIRSWHVISNSFSTPSDTILGNDKTLDFAFWKTWPPPNLITDYINSTDSFTSDSSALTTRNPPENFYFFRGDSRGVVIFKHHLPHRGMSCTKFPWWSVSRTNFSVNRNEQSCPPKKNSFKSWVWVLCPRPSVEFEYHDSLTLNSTHDKPVLYSTQQYLLVLM